MFCFVLGIFWWNDNARDDIAVDLHVPISACIGGVLRLARSISCVVCLAPSHDGASISNSSERKYLVLILMSWLRSVGAGNPNARASK